MSYSLTAPREFFELKEDSRQAKLAITQRLLARYRPCATPSEGERRQQTPSASNSQAWACNEALIKRPSSQHVRAVPACKRQRLKRPARGRKADHLEQLTHFMLGHQLMGHAALGHAGAFELGGQAAVPEEMGLAGVAQRLEPGVLARQDDAGEFDVSGGVLLAR